MKKLLAVLSVLALLLVAGPVAADWVDDLKPLPPEVTYIGVIFQGDDGVVIIRTKSGCCVEYKIEGDRIVKMRGCDNEDWGDFVKKGI